MLRNTLDGMHEMDEVVQGYPLPPHTEIEITTYITIYLSNTFLTETLLLMTDNSSRRHPDSGNLWTTYKSPWIYVIKVINVINVCQIARTPCSGLIALRVLYSLLFYLFRFYCLFMFSMPNWRNFYSIFVTSSDICICLEITLILLDCFVVDCMCVCVDIY